MKTYDIFDIRDVAEKGRNYITRMVDARRDSLPYWFIHINEAPAYAKHVRVDDAELVASWYEAIVALEKILGPSPESADVREGFKRHLLKSWGPMGLRYHEPYPWTHTQHASFHEQGWVLAGLNRLLLEEPDNKQVDQLAKGMVRGMRKLVYQRKKRVFWSGDYPIGEKIYEFPGDIYLQEGGFDHEKITGRGEMPIRNAVILEGLVDRARLFGDEDALDLAEGIANHLLGLARYFHWDMSYPGHVHSTMWFAIGLLKLGKLTKNSEHIEKAVTMFEYTRSISSSFGWVPEYAQWHKPAEEFCETCCIKDMIVFALEAVEIGYDYWDLIHTYTRNQLSEQQVKTGCFVAVDNEREDTDETTWRDMDQRIVGGWSGGAEPNSISLKRFRSIAGCCVGTAPVALWMVWDKILEETPDGLRINYPIARIDERADVKIGYPNHGFMQVTAKRDGAYLLRTFAWMGDKVELRLDGRALAHTYVDGCLLIEHVKAGQVITLNHPIVDRVEKETVQGREWTVTWRGPDVINIDPASDHLKLYQRESGAEKDYPLPPKASSGKSISLSPTN